MTIDIKKIEQEATQEIAEERSRIAKGKIKDSLKKIAAAEAVLRNLRGEHAFLLREIGEDV